MRPCWMLQEKEVCFVHLGKYGDIMIMLPAFKTISEQIGKPVTCIVSKDYWSIFEGVSYVNPIVVEYHWWKGVKRAKEYALRLGYDPIVVKWWDEPGAKPPGQLDAPKKISLTIHGNRTVIDANEWDSFQASQWRYAGFTMEQMMTWPLVFDRRNKDREYALCSKYFTRNEKYLLVNLSMTGTSPFRHAAQAMALCRKVGVHVINLQAVRAHRIYDLLGLYDMANGLITSDTSTLHLASASDIPYIALLNNGGSGSIPKGNCIKSIRYGDFHKKLGEYMSAVDKLCSN